MLPPTDDPDLRRRPRPKNLELTGELADGWLGNAFLPEHAEEFLVTSNRRRAGRPHARRARPRDAGGGRGHRRPRGGGPPPRPWIRLHDRGDGVAGQELLQRRVRPQGFADDVAAVQDLWLAGRREEAAERVPIELGMNTNLLGPPDGDP